MTMALRVLVVLLGSIFVLTGLTWYIDPARPAERLGMALLDGVGRSSQIGDFSAFFLTAGICVLFGVVTRQRFWFYPTAMMMALAATGRILAWLIQDAALAVDMIGAEVFFAVIVLFASRRLTEQGA